jgi:hypothetical protein
MAYGTRLLMMAHGSQHGRIDQVAAERARRLFFEPISCALFQSAGYLSLLYTFLKTMQYAVAEDRKIS